jgi:hypothetical protein
MCVTSDGRAKLKMTAERGKKEYIKTLDSSRMESSLTITTSSYKPLTLYQSCSSPKLSFSPFLASGRISSRVTTTNHHLTNDSIAPPGLQCQLMQLSRLLPASPPLLHLPQQVASAMSSADVSARGHANATSVEIATTATGVGEEETALVHGS